LIGSDTFSHGLGKRSETILLALRDDLQRGVYKEGDRLPTEKELCDRFGTSRPTVRRAISRLVADGIVSVRKGSGAFVRAAAPELSVPATISVMYNFRGRELTVAQDHALKAGYTFCIFSQDRDHWRVESERAFLQIVHRDRHPGLLAYCSPLEPTNDDMLEKLAAGGTRVIHIEHYREQLPDQEYLLPDYSRAGHMGAVALMLSGYTRVVMLGSNMTAPYARLVRQGFVSAIGEHRTGFDAARDFFEIPPALNERPDVLRNLKRFIVGDGSPVGVLCTCQTGAEHFKNLVDQWGLSVPDNVGIIAPTLASPNQKPNQFDELSFDRIGGMARAIDAVVTPGISPLRELMQPELVRHGTTMTA